MIIACDFAQNLFKVSLSLKREKPSVFELLFKNVEEPTVMQLGGIHRVQMKPLISEKYTLNFSMILAKRAFISLAARSSKGPKK